MKYLALLLLAGTFLSNPNSNAQMAKSTSIKPTIIFVHGLWADGSCWSKVIPSLLKQGFNVISVQNPTTSLEDDVAAAKRAINEPSYDLVYLRTQNNDKDPGMGFASGQDKVRTARG